MASSRELNPYDTSCLEMAPRLRLPLASLDRKLRPAAFACGVALLGR